jgi:hypothetical protein
VDRAQQEAEAALKAWDEGVTEEAKEPEVQRQFKQNPRATASASRVSTGQRYSRKAQVSSLGNSGSADFLSGFTLVIGGILFLAAPWIIMLSTGLAYNSNALGENNLLAPLIMIACGLWGCANICIVIYLAFAGLGTLFSWISKS